MTYEEQVEAFKKKQADIMELQAKLKEAEAALQAQVEEYIAAHKGTVNEIGQKLERLMQEYRAELKAWVGITDGEKASVLDLVEAVKRVQALA